MALCSLGQGVEQDGPPSGPGWHEGTDFFLGQLILTPLLPRPGLNMPGWQICMNQPAPARGQNQLRTEGVGWASPTCRAPLRKAAPPGKIFSIFTMGCTLDSIPPEMLMPRESDKHRIRVCHPPTAQSS